MKKADTSETPGPKKLFRLVYKFLLISLGVHVIGLITFGGFVILQKLQPEEVTFVAPPPTLVRVEPKKRQYKLRAQQQQQRSGRPRLESRLQSTRESSFALPEIKTRVAPVKQKMVTIPGLSSGLGDGLGFGGMGISGKGSIFGVTIEAEHLGVILDVSYSTHRVIDEAILEIQKAFPDALIVLGPGCGLSPGRPEGDVVSASKFDRNREDYASANFDFEITDYLSRDPQTRGLMVTNRKFNELFETGKEKDQMFVVTWNRRTHIAFEWLMKEKVDAIYWFADFQDPQDPEIIDDLVKKLNRRNIKVYQQVLESGRPIPDGFILSEKTGGKVIRTDRQRR